MEPVLAIALLLAGGLSTSFNSNSERKEEIRGALKGQSQPLAAKESKDKSFKAQLENSGLSNTANIGFPKL